MEVSYQIFIIFRNLIMLARRNKFYSQKPPMFCHSSWGEVRHTWLVGTTGDSIAKQCSIVMVYSVKKMNFFTVWITFQSQCTGFGNWGIDDSIIIKWGVFWKILLDLLKFSFKLFGWEKSHLFLRGQPQLESSLPWCEFCI